MRRREILKNIGAALLFTSLSRIFAQVPTSKVKAAGGHYSDLSPAQFKGRLGAPGSRLLVNTHVPYEGEIEGTDLFVPFNRVAEDLGLFPRDKSTEILVYCRSGQMSIIAAEVLGKAGYTNIKNLQGGMIAWREAGYPLRTVR